MNSRRRYQLGSLSRRKRKKSGDVWQYRFYELESDGRRTRRSINIGSVREFHNRAQALTAVAALNLKLNSADPLAGSVTVAHLIERYIADSLPERHSTRVSYQALIRRWIKPRWGGLRLREVKVVAVEEWLRNLELAPKSKTNIRNLMHLLFQHACRWEWIDRNPIALVRQSGKRLQIPRVLLPEEVRSLLLELAEPFRTMVMLAVCLGLRVSEIIGLKWGDFDWSGRTVLVQRSVVNGRAGETKTEYSRRPVPLDVELVAQLQQWRNAAFYRSDDDWVFAADSGKPRWQETILKRNLKPAAERAGIGKIGWHTFRHTYSTMLRAVGTDIKVQQELLRHADIQTTLNTYTQALAPAKWEAQSKVVQMVLERKPLPLLNGRQSDAEMVSGNR